MDNQIVNQSTQTSETPPQINTPTPQPISQHIQNPPKNSNLLIIILVVAIVVTGIVFGILVTKLLSDANKSASVTNIEGTESWLTYTNKALKYSISYPSSWTLQNLSNGKLIKIYNQPDKTKPVGEIFIEKVSLVPININEYVDTVAIGNTQFRCYSDQVSKTWCYLENGKSIKISLLIIKDQDETYNLVLYKILSTFNLRSELAKISTEQLTAGWYWGNKEQKLPGTPLTWTYTEAGKSSCWHKAGVTCKEVSNTTVNYSCPASGWVDCMPVLDATKTAACSFEAMEWYKTNCPNFQGAAL